MKQSVFGKWKKLTTKNFNKWCMRCRFWSKNGAECTALSSYEDDQVTCMKRCDPRTCPRYGDDIKPDDLYKSVILRKHPPKW